MPRKLSLEIERGSNGGLVVTYIKTFPTSLQKMTGIKAETETLAFATPKDFTEWLIIVDMY